MSVILFLLIILIYLILCGVIVLHLRKKKVEKLNEAKFKLEENALIKFNHSYRLINKKDKSIRYIRVFSILLDKEVKVNCFLTTKDGEIGTWCDKIEFLYKIKDNYILEDCGEWK